MKIFQKLGLSLAFILAFTVFAIAQTERNQSKTPPKLVVINTDAFEDEKTGIDELARIIKKLNDEFKPKTEELKLMDKKIRDFATELGQLADVYELTGTTITKEFLNDKIKERDLLVSKFESRQKEIKSLYEERKLEMTEDINKKITEALKQFTKEKGYELILDISRMRNSFMVADYDNDITVEFITYYKSLLAKQQ